MENPQKKARAVAFLYKTKEEAQKVLENYYNWYAMFWTKIAAVSIAGMALTTAAEIYFTDNEFIAERANSSFGWFAIGAVVTAGIAAHARFIALPLAIKELNENPEN